MQLLERLDVGLWFPEMIPVMSEALGSQRPDTQATAISQMSHMNRQGPDSEGMGTDFIGLGKLLVGMAVKYMPWIAALLLTCVGLAVIATILATPVYRAAGVVQIQPEEGRIVSVDDVVENSRGSDSLAYYQTQYGLLRSRTLAERVATRIGVQVLVPPSSTETTPLSPQRARDLAVARVSAGVSVRPVTGSRLVSIEYLDPNPELAAKIVDGYIDEFIAVSMERRFEASAYARTFLETRLNELRGRIEETERNLVQYADDADLIASAPDAESETAGALKALVAAHSEAIQRRIEAEERAALVTRQTSELPEIVNSIPLQNLRADLIRAQAELAERRQIFGPDYPAVRQIEGRVQSFQQQINAETARLQAAVLGEARANLNARLKVEAQLLGEIAEVRIAARDVDRRSIDYNILRRELDTNKTLYDGLLQRYREIGIAGGIGVNNITVVDRAIVPKSPVSPRPIINLMIGLLAGIGLSAATVFVLENWKQGIRRPDELEKQFGLTLLGVVPKFSDDRSILTELEDNRSAATEAYHAVRTGILFSGAARLPKSILFTSSRPSEGKTTSAVSTATIFARAGLRVILVDGDMRDPSLHGLFALRNKTGLAEVLAGIARVEDVLIQTPESNLMLVTAGALPENAAELLSRPSARAGLTAFENVCDLLIVDAPPVLGLADSPLMSTMVDTTIFVVGANLASRSVIQRSLERLKGARTNLIGAVFTKFDAKKESYGGYDYGTTYGDGGYGYGNNSSETAAKPS